MCPIIIKMTRKSLCVIKSEILVRMQGYKNAFFVPCACGLKTFQNNSHNLNLGRSSNECMAISMLPPTTQRKKVALIFSTRKMLVLGVQRHLVTRLTSLQMSTICFILCWQPSLIEKLYCSYGKVVFQCVSLL